MAVPLGCHVCCSLPGMLVPVVSGETPRSPCMEQRCGRDHGRTRGAGRGRRVLPIPLASHRLLGLTGSQTPRASGVVGKRPPGGGEVAGQPPQPVCASEAARNLECASHPVSPAQELLVANKHSHSGWGWQGPSDPKEGQGTGGWARPHPSSGPCCVAPSLSLALSVSVSTSCCGGTNPRAVLRLLSDGSWGTWRNTCRAAVGAP